MVLIKLAYCIFIPYCIFILRRVVREISSGPGRTGRPGILTRFQQLRRAQHLKRPLAMQHQPASVLLQSFDTQVEHYHLRNRDRVKMLL
jgi:hypothetical protein